MNLEPLTFVGACLAAGAAQGVEDAVASFSKLWPNKERALHHSLGLTAAEYARWVKDAAALDAILVERKKWRKPAFGGAEFSPDGRYRRRLWRDYLPPGEAPVGSRILFVGLNPSKAGYLGDDDATVRRWNGYTAAWGYTGYTAVNLVDLVATDPKVMKATPVLELDNGNDALKRALVDDRTGLVVVCWGANVNTPFLQERAWSVLNAIDVSGLRPYCFGKTANEEPQHPLRLRADLLPVLYGRAR